jgi:hypothetical protein
LIPVVCLAIAVIACGARTSPSVPDPDLDLVIGYGRPESASDFRALADGDAVPLTAGPQGGQHIWIQLRSRGLWLDHSHIRLSIIRVADNSTIGVSQFRDVRWSAHSTQPGTFITFPSTAVLDNEHYCVPVPPTT